MRAFPFTRARKTTGTGAWDEQVYSAQGFAGGAYASARAVGYHTMFGLNTDPTTDPSYFSIDYAIYTTNGGEIYAYESGTQVLPRLGTYVPGDLLAIYYWWDGVNWIITYAQNGVALRSIAVSAGFTFYFDSSYYAVAGQPDPGWNDIRFGPNAGQVTGTFIASAGMQFVQGIWPLLEGPEYTIHLQSESQDADGRWQSHNTLQGRDWATSFKYRGDSDTPYVAGSLELARADRTLSMAPLITGSLVNRNAAAVYAPFLDVGRRIRVRTAILPKGVAPFSGIGGIWTSSGVTLASTAAAINNGDVVNNAFHTDTAVPGAWIQVDMGIATEFDQLRAWSNYPSAAVWQIQGSQDAILWTNILGFPNAAQDGTTYFPRAKYRYWRLLLINTPGAGPWSFELQFNRDWREILDGYIDKVGIGSRDDNAIAIDCRDLGALLIDTDIEIVRQYGSGGGTAVETVMQQILDDNLGAGAVTLYTPVSPNWFLHEFSQKLTSVMEAIRALAKQIGYEIRYVYDANNNLRLTFYAPDRAKTISDYAIGPTVYTDITKLDLDIVDVRNAWTVEFIDRVSGNKLSSIATSAPSIAQYKRRPAKIAYGYTSNIDSITEADKMTAAAVADTAFPKALEVIDVMYLPIVDLADVITLMPNGEHYDTEQARAVYAFDHDLRDGDGTTTLTTRGKPSGGYDTWMSMVGGMLDGPSLVALDIPGGTPAANHLVSYSGSWDTIQLSINGAAWIVPGASPLTVTPNAAGGIAKQYTFRAIKNGQIVTQTVYVNPPPPLPPQATIVHLDTEVNDNSWNVRMSGIAGSGGGGANLTWVARDKIGFLPDTTFASGNGTTLPRDQVVTRDPRSTRVISMIVTDTITGLSSTARLTVPSARPEINNTGNPYRNRPFDDGNYAPRATDTVGQILHFGVVDSRSFALNTHFNTASHTMDNVPEGGTYGKASFTRLGYSDRAGSAIDSSNFVLGSSLVRSRGFTDTFYAAAASNTSGFGLHSSTTDSRGFGLNAHFNTSAHTMDNVPEGGTYGKSSFTRLGYADRAGNTIDSGNAIIAGHIIRSRTIDDGLYMLRSGSTDGRIITASDPYFSDTGNYVSSAYQRGTHSLDNIVDGASYLKVFGVAAGLVTPQSSQSHFLCRVYKTSNQSIPSGTITPVTWDVDHVDVANLHDTVTNNSRITINAAGGNGTWLIIANIVWAVSSLGYRRVQIFNNVYGVIGDVNNDGGEQTALGVMQQCCTLSIAVGTGDWFECRVSHNAGSALNIIGTVTGSWFAAIHLW